MLYSFEDSLNLQQLSLQNRCKMVLRMFVGIHGFLWKALPSCSHKYARSPERTRCWHESVGSISRCHITLPKAQPARQEADVSPLTYRYLQEYSWKMLEIHGRSWKLLELRSLSVPSVQKARLRAKVRQSVRLHWAVSTCRLMPSQFETACTSSFSVLRSALWGNPCAAPRLGLRSPGA